MDFYELGQKTALLKFAVGQRQMARITAAATSQGGNESIPGHYPGHLGRHMASAARDLGGVNPETVQHLTQIGPVVSPGLSVKDNLERRATKRFMRDPELDYTFGAQGAADKVMNVGPAEHAALMSRVNGQAMSGRHTKTLVGVPAPLPGFLPAEKHVKHLAGVPGTDPGQYAYRGTSDVDFDLRAHEPRTPRWVSGSPSIASGYGDTLQAHRMPPGQTLDRGPWTKHVAVDTRDQPDLALAALPVSPLARSNQKEFPYYERVVSHKELEPSLIAQYKKLPMQIDRDKTPVPQFQQVRGKENPLATPSVLP